MSKKKFLFLIPFLVVAGVLVYCWTAILNGEVVATWRHYIGLILFILLVFLAIKAFTKAVVGLGVFLLLATFNVLAITPAISTSWLTIGRMSTPPVQLLSLGILALYCILNMDTLIEIQLDYKEAKAQNQETT